MALNRSERAPSIARDTITLISKGTPLGPRLVILSAIGIVPLSIINSVSSIVFMHEYIDWMLALKGFNRDSAPIGEIPGIQISLWIRALFSVALIASITQFGRLIAVKRPANGWVLGSVGAIACIGYAMLTTTGGPIWSIVIRLVQSGLGLLVLVALGQRSTRHWFTTAQELQSNTQDAETR